MIIKIYKYKEHLMAQDAMGTKPGRGKGRPTPPIHTHSERRPLGAKQGSRNLKHHFSLYFVCAEQVCLHMGKSETCIYDNKNQNHGYLFGKLTAKGQERISRDGMNNEYPGVGVARWV